MNISLETKVLTTSSDPLLNTIFDNNQIIMKFKPHYNQEEKIELILLICKKLLTKRAKAKRLIKKHKNNPVELAYFSSKSNVLKVLANSTYGETGYLYSSFYRKTIVSSVTAFSCEILKKVISFLELQQCCIIYDDTDSVFFMIPKQYFFKIGQSYSQNKQLYHQKSIEKSISYIKQIKDTVNEYICQVNDSSYIEIV
ncbi:1888_t:CDS:1, partial [Dentiscutata heterogama]